MFDINKIIINLIMIIVGGSGSYAYNEYSNRVDMVEAISSLENAIRYSDENYHKEVLRVVRKNETIIERICK